MTVTAEPSPWRRVACALAVLSLAPAALAQNSGIQGVVTDASGGVIPAASITVANVATGVEYDAQSNETGFYSVPFLSPGTYTVTAQTEAFAPSTRENLKLDVQQIARVDFELSVGTVTEVVEVSAAAALLESEQATMGQVIENKRIVEMPLNKRNYLELAQLSVGILPGSTVGAGTRPGRSGEAGFVGMGMRGYQNNVMIDGIDNGSRAGGGPLGFQAQASKPSVDAVAEFKVVTNNMSAEYGFRMGPKVLVSIRSGSNDLHGSAFEFIRNDKLDATNFFANRSGSVKPTLRQNQFGGTLGGPIMKNKTFGFFSYQGTRIRVGRSFLATVPAQLTRSGDFSMERRNHNMVFDPESTVGTGAAAIRDPFPNNVIPASRFDPVSTPLLSRYPLPNVQGREFGFNNYFRAPSGFDYRRLNIFREAMRFRRGAFQFNRVFTAEMPNNGRSRSTTGNGLAEMMLGWAALTRVGNPAGENAVVPYWGTYIQDDWKVTPKFTLTLGLRWELFHRGYFPRGHIKGRTGVSNYITVFNGLQPGQEEFRARPVDGSDCGCEQDYNNFAPRVGIAYRLNNKTVVRASGGIFLRRVRQRDLWRRGVVSSSAGLHRGHHPNP